MKRSRYVEPARNHRTKRDLFAELKEGLGALADMRDGKRTLRSHSIEVGQRVLSTLKKTR